MKRKLVLAGTNAAHPSSVGGPMRRRKTPSFRLLFVAGLFFVAASSSQVGGQAAQATGLTVFEGARFIVGDGSAPIEDAAFIVEKHYFTQVGRKGQLRIPAGAVRVDLTGKTVMLAIIDTHAHIEGTREQIIDQLQHMAYHGIAAATSLGEDPPETYELRNPIPGVTLFRTAGRGIITPQAARSAAGRAATGDRPVSDIRYWVTTDTGLRPKRRPERPCRS